MAAISFRSGLQALIDSIQTETQDKPRPEAIRHAFFLAGQKKDNLHAAVCLAAVGIPVFPFRLIKEGGKEKKVPACTNGDKDATTDVAQILKWWGQQGDPPLLVGLIVPPELVVVDVDNHGNENGQKEFEKARLAANAPEPQTFTTFTPRVGRHLYFLRPAGLNTKSVLFPGVELLTRWITDFSKRGDGREYGIFANEPFAPLPAWLTPRPAPAEPRTYANGSIAFSGPDPYLKAAIANAADELAKRETGSRNQSLNDTALRLLRLNLFDMQRGYPDASGIIHDTLRAACESNRLIADDGATSFEKTYESARVAAEKIGPAPYALTKGGSMHDAQTEGISLNDKAVADTLKESGLQLRTLADDAEEPLPEEVLHPGGLLEDIMNFTMASSSRTRPIYALAGALVTLGTLAGQRVKTESGAVTNIYAAIIGPSTDGKDAPCDTVARLVTAATDRRAYGGSDIASAPAILAMLAKEPRSACTFSELGSFLQGTKLKGSPKAGIMPVFTDLFSAAKRPFKKAFADSEKNIYIPRHALNLLGTSVPGEFWPALQSGETSNGFLGRWLIFEAKGNLSPRNKHVCTDIPNALLGGLKEVWAIDAGDTPAPVVEGNGNINLTKSLAPANPKPHLIPYSDDARAMLEGICDQCDTRVNEANGKGDDAAASIIGRAAEHTMKLALLHAVSRARGTIVAGQIEKQDLAWAWALVSVLSRRLVAKLKSVIFETKFEELGSILEAAIQRYIQRDHIKHPDRPAKPGAPKSELQKALKGQPPRVVDEVIDKLIKMKRLILIEGWKNSENSKRPLDLYCLVADRDGD